MNYTGMVGELNRIKEDTITRFPDIVAYQNQCFTAIQEISNLCSIESQKRDKYLTYTFQLLGRNTMPLLWAKDLILYRDLQTAYILFRAVLENVYTLRYLNKNPNKIEDWVNNHDWPHMTRKGGILENLFGPETSPTYKKEFEQYKLYSKFAHSAYITHLLNICQKKGEMRKLPSGVKQINAKIAFIAIEADDKLMLASFNRWFHLWTLTIKAFCEPYECFIRDKESFKKACELDHITSKLVEEYKNKIESQSPQSQQKLSITDSTSQKQDTKEVVLEDAACNSKEKEEG